MVSVQSICDAATHDEEPTVETTEAFFPVRSKTELKSEGFSRRCSAAYRVVLWLEAAGWQHIQNLTSLSSFGPLKNLVWALSHWEIDVLSASPLNTTLQNGTECSWPFILFQYFFPGAVLLFSEAISYFTLAASEKIFCAKTEDIMWERVEMMECARLDWKVVSPPPDDAFRVHTAARRSFQPFFLAQKQNGGIKNTIKQQRSHQSGTLQGRYKTGY